MLRGSAYIAAGADKEPSVPVVIAWSPNVFAIELMPTLAPAVVVPELACTSMPNLVLASPELSITRMNWPTMVLAVLVGELTMICRSPKCVPPVEESNVMYSFMPAMPK